MTIDAASEDFLQANETYNEFAVLAAQLDEPQQSDASVAQLARWFSAQNTFLQDNLDVVAAEQGGTVTLTLDPAGIAGLAYSQAGSGYRDSAAGNNHQFLASDVAYIASAKNSVILQLATAEQPIVQDHEFEAEYEIQALDGPDPDGEGGPSPTVDFTTTFSAAPPLAAAATTLTAQDQAFINAAYDDGALGVQEGELAMSLGGSLNLQLYGAWNIVNDGPLDADIASLASTGQGTVPGALSATSQAQLATLAGLFSGLNGVAQVAAYSIINDQKTIADYSAEITAGSDPALVALAKAALPGAGALLAQAVILYGELAGGLQDNPIGDHPATNAVAAPDTFAGAILNAAGNAAATGNAVITGYQATASLPIPAAGQTGIDFVSAADATAAPGYAFVIDTAASASTISGAADRFEAVSGAAAGMTYYGGSGGFGDIALTDGTNSVVGASDAGNYFVGAQGGNNAIYAGNGDDTIATSSYPATPFVDPSDYTPSPTIGTNLIGLGSGANVVIADANDTIVGSTGNDTVYATGDASQVFAGSKGITYVAGAYVLGAVYTGAAGGTVYGGNGSVVNVIGSGGVLIASAGNETLQSALSLGQLLTHSASIAGGQVGSTFFAGSGSDNLAGSGSRDLFYAGTGTATIDGGGGADIVAFVNGAAGGADTVAFTNQDHVSLVGYGSAAVSQAIASSATIAGGVRFSLPDNTLVTLTGATSLTVSDFT